MSESAVGRSELERFRSAVGERLGLWLDDTKLPELKLLLDRRAAANALTTADYVALVEDAARGGVERRALAQTLTVTETFFFRQNAQIAALIDHLELHGGPVRVLSAGCASGEEPYSLAIALREHLPQHAGTAVLRAIDINATMLARATAAKYSSWSLRETPDALAQRWFRRDAANNFLLEREIREAVTFQERNLVESNLDLLTTATYDAVFFRNVLMYFTPHVAASVIARIANALVPGGLLFLGYAETLRGLSTAFHLRHTRETFYYQKKDGASVSTQPRGPVTRESSGLPLPLPLPGDLDWYESIGRASERIKTLADGRPALAQHETTPTAAHQSAGFDLARTFELLRKERFDEALDTMQALPHAATTDPDVLLLRCALLVHSGKLEAARSTCTLLLERDELNAGAHYLLALLCEGERDLHGAGEHDRIAAYLDPAFAMPRLHLGLLARRKGDVLAARRELRQAYALLEREDTARLMLFAGGFERAALLALCNSELLACGGAL